MQDGSNRPARADRRKPFGFRELVDEPSARGLPGSRRLAHAVCRRNSAALVMKIHDPYRAKQLKHCSFEMRYPPMTKLKNSQPHRFDHAMKTLILTFLSCCIIAMHVHAAEEPLIPTALNDVLLKIRPGMTTNQVLAVLSPSYPKVAGRMGDWSGQSGYIDYKLDERFTLSVSSVMSDGRQLVHDNLLFYVFDWQTKRRVDIKLYFGEGKSHQEPIKK